VSITVKNVVKKFGNFVALDDVSLDVQAGSLLALLGPSGSGKTTLLRIIAGLEGADRGSVLYHDEDVTKRSPRDRNVGFVFQHYALFRHMTVFENVAFGLRVRRTPKSQVEARVRELLHLVRLDGFGGRYPPQLSGGQRQRVALARALAVEPAVLLLDEPFGALDAKVRQELRQWLRRFHDEIKVTTIFVTHDQEEAFEVADHVVVMHNGRIEQYGTPQEVFDRPANPFVMDFLGNVNVFQGRIQDGKMLLGGIEMAYPEYPHGESRAATAYIRPHELDIDRSPAYASSLPARVLQINPNGSVAKVRLSSENSQLELNVEINLDRYAELGLQPGDLVHVSPRRFRVFLPEDYAI
jgi:sulfate transport system ATP-binding protein